MLSRIVAVADVFDALTSQRPYRNAMSFSQGLKIIRDESKRGFFYDKGVTDALANVAGRFDTDGVTIATLPDRQFEYVAQSRGNA